VPTASASPVPKQKWQSLHAFGLVQLGRPIAEFPSAVGTGLSALFILLSEQ